MRSPTFSNSKWGVTLCYQFIILTVMPTHFILPILHSYIESIFKNHAVTGHGKNFKSKPNEMSCRSTTQALLSYIHIVKGYKLLHQSLFCQGKKSCLREEKRRFYSDGMAYYISLRINTQLYMSFNSFVKFALGSSL